MHFLVWIGVINFFRLTGGIPPNPFWFPPESPFQRSFRDENVGPNVPFVSVMARQVPSALRAGVGFADTSYNVEIPENSPGNTLIKTLLLTNKPSLNFPVQCNIESGNEKGHFVVIVNVNRDCELRTLGQQLDYEIQRHYVLTVVLRTLISIIDPSRSIATVNINVKDVNDNRPSFVFEPNHLVEDMYYASVPHDLSAQSFICRISAEDRDSDSNGRIIYNITSASRSGFFAIGETTGIVTNLRTLHDVPSQHLPFRLTVMARDKPGAVTGFLTTLAPLFINLIEDRHRLVLVLIDIEPEKVVENKPKLVDFLQERTGMVIGIEKIEPRRYIANSTYTQPAGTDVTFYAIDQLTHRILPYDDPRMLSYFLQAEGQYSLLYTLSTALAMTGTTIHRPLSTTGSILLAGKTLEDMDGFQAALLALACIIIILGIVGIVYMCFIWSRYTAYRLQLQQLLVSPRLEPILVEPSLKEYETQVLQMTVHPDDNDTDYLHNMDTDSFAKEIGAQSTLVLEDSSYADSDSLGADRVRHQTYGSRDELECYEGKVLVPALNPLYHSSDETNGHRRTNKKVIVADPAPDVTEL